MTKKLIISLVVLVAILVAGIGGWLYVTRSPEYSLVLAARAVKNHDYQGFKQYVDVGQIVSDLVNDAVAEIQKQVNEDTEGDPWAQLGANLGSAFIGAYTPQLKEQFTDQIRKGVEEGNFGREGTDASKISFFDFWTKTTVEKEGKVAKITTPTFKLQNDQPFSFNMRQSNGRWQVFSIDFDVSDLASNDAPAAADTTQRVAFGTRTDIGEGWFLTATQPEAYTPTNQFSQPPEGKKYVAVEITYENTSTTKDSFSTSRLTLKDTEDHAYTSTFFDSKEPSLSSGDLEPSGTIKGYVTYSMPIELDPKQLVYSSSHATVIFEQQ
ncbi:MAG: DUF4352 domain-containing protein [Candidatus Andersenbacteria bacterium]|nr:DUF4352 domain-containing protein [Candidatus Andersenbacteria bacterium]MBI3250825.1 DUF4352 domain-containing protein [Candidatus Andersenbacteria bacterium]